MKTNQSMFKLLAVAAALAAAGPALALTYTGATVQGGTSVTDFSGNGQLSFDVDFAGLAPATLRYTVSADDLSMPIDFSAVLRNFSSQGFTGYTLALSRGSFASIGSVTRQFGGSAAVGSVGGTATLSFSTPEFLDVEIGNALGNTPGANDWRLGGLQAGDTFGISISPVPEPGTYALWLAGLLCMGFIARRQRG